MSANPEYRRAVVTAPIAPGHPGEVVVSYPPQSGYGTTDTFIAISSETLHVGDQVVVLYRAGGKTVVVAANP